MEDVEHLGHGLRFRNENFPGYNQPKKYEGKGKHRYRVLAKEGDKVKVIKNLYLLGYVVLNNSYAVRRDLQ